MKKTNNIKGELLKQARIKKGILQKELGELLGYPDASAQIQIANWERGFRSVPRKHLKKISELLEINPLDLI